MSSKDDGSQNPKVLKLGFNISVSGDPGTDFEIVFDEKGQNASQNSFQNEIQYHDSEADELGNTDTSSEVKKTKDNGKFDPKRRSKLTNDSSSQMVSEESEKTSEAGDIKSKGTNLINEIKTTMEHFDKFSGHIKEIPRLRSYPVATSTPLFDKNNSKSESNLVNTEYRPRKFSHLSDFYLRNQYYRSSVRPLPSDLFLKPLPGDDFYRRGIYSSYFDSEPYRHYGSDNSINKITEYKTVAKTDVERYDICNVHSDPPIGILKKSESECGDKQSTSSADSVKDIKIYQSGGILIMQNFKDNFDLTEKKEISEFSAKLIENCNKLRKEIKGFEEDKPFSGNSLDENKHSGKSVQFDLTSIEDQKSKYDDTPSIAPKDETSSTKLESSESTSDCLKNKDSSPQGVSSSQDFPSISTQENDSTISNQPGMSPTYVSSKKLEWDSGADIGYVNLDLSKENLSTIERIVLKGLSRDGFSEKNIVYEPKGGKNQTNRSKLILERKPSSLIIEEIQQEDHEMVSDDFNNKTKKKEISHKEKKTKNLSKAEIENKKIGSTEFLKGEKCFEIETTTPSSKDSSGFRPKIKLKDKHSGLVDKSVNVNTLWDDINRETSLSESAENIKPSESYPKFKARKPSPKIKKLKKKKVHTSRVETVGNIGRRSKSCIDASTDMGVPKNNYKNTEAIPLSLGGAELSKEVEEIIVDQSFKTKETVMVEQEGTKDPSKDKPETKHDIKTKSRPISASSSSNNTVLPKVVEEKPKTEVPGKFTDQVIQTSVIDQESVGIQAFSSQVSSDCEFKCVKKNESSKPAYKNGREINTSSKNIQAYGTNCSLPKELAHPKESEVINNQNTKSTQFFGGPINSLPNYHSNLVTKPGETCGREPKVLKAKKNLEAEIIRLQEENAKNILANDSNKSKQKKPSNKDDKENLISKKTTESKRSRSNASQKTASQESEKKDNESEKKKTGSDGLHTSDEVSSTILTSEILKVHGGSIDRNIIQEKYFQSQLAEFEMRKMITRSTSMELTSNKCMSIGCQYSPQSKETTSGEQSKQQDYDNESLQDKTQRRLNSEQYDSSQNMAEECFETLKSTVQEQGTGESLPSSTQTAHSWVPGIQNSGENHSGVGKARSFEYLPGHIYESSGNLREELPSETEQNLTSGNSSDSDLPKGSVSEDVKDSEGRNTLILENSTESSYDNDHLKILDENLMQLNLTVMKLWEKDAQLQNITQSLLENFKKKNGSGDSSAIAGEDASKKNSLSEVQVQEYNNDRGDSEAEQNGRSVQKNFGEKEISKSCQTEDKLLSVEENFYKEKIALEKRISEEKKCQIKCIENEIYHLNLLRSLLEKQDSPVQRKKKHSFLSITSKSPSEAEEDISAKANSRSVTPAYGCRIVMEGKPPEKHSHNNEQSSCGQHKGRDQGCGNYGMRVSLRGSPTNWQPVVSLPVGMQFSVNDSSGKCFEEQHFSKVHSSRNTLPRQSGRAYCSDVNTQFPTERRICKNFTSVSVQTGFSSPRRCDRCDLENCVCLNLDKNSRSCRSSPLSQFSRSRTPEKSSKLCSPHEENIACVSTDHFERSETPCGSHGRAKSSQGVHCKCQSSENSHETCKNPKSQCQNCSIIVSCTDGDSKSTCPRCCQSVIYLNSDKSSKSNCSKTKKSENCKCHVIKIHRSKCHSHQCSCKTKKTENQCCQTDYVKVMTDDSCCSTRSSRTGKKTGPCFQEVTCNKGIQCECSGNSQKNISAGRSCKEESSSENCSCKTKVIRKTKVPHPTHYFLKIEETEVDEEDEDVCEPKKEKNVLEVITVKVPVKKGKKKKVQRDCESNRKSKESLEKCNCCEQCAGNKPKSLPKSEPCMSNYQRSVAEKPESPRRDVTRGSKPTGNEFFTCENNYNEDFNSYYRNSAVKYFEDIINNCNDGNNYKANAKNCNKISTTNCSGSSTKEVTHSCQGCHPAQRKPCMPSERNLSDRQANCTSQGRYPSSERGVFFQGPPSEYDSHKKANTKKHCVENTSRSFEDERNFLNLPSTSENCSTEKFSTESNGFDRDYYNYNKREFMTRSEILREEEQKRKAKQPSLQECLSSNRPDFYNSAERRRLIICERAKERLKRQNCRLENLINMVHNRNVGAQPNPNTGPKRIFTTSQMREQTRKRYKKLPEVTGKLADQKKKCEYQTNRLMADIFAKKLQNEALKGHINLSNSVALLYTL